MKNEMIVYRSDEREQVLVDASQKALEELGMYNGCSKVTASYDLLTALSDAVKRSNLILVLITKSEYIKIKKIVSKSLGIELVKNSTISKKLGRLSDDKEFQLHDNFPKGSVVLESKDALYSGYYLKSGNQSIVFSPLDVVRTEGILEKAGIKLDIECVSKRKLRFIGVPQAKLESSIKEIGGVKSYFINDLRGELEVTIETADSSEELAQEQSRAVISQLKRLYKSKLYAVDGYGLATLTISTLETERNQLAIADTDNSSLIVGYLASDNRAGDWCKKIRLSSAHSKADTQEAISELVRKVRNRSGFELAVALGDEYFDEEKSRDCIYGALANENGILTKRFAKFSGETDADFRTRCAKELVLLLYNDRIGDGEYSSAKPSRRAKPQKEEKPVKKHRPVPERGVEEESPEIVERRNKVAPKEDRSVTRTKVIVMLVLVVVVIAVAILVSRGGDGADSTDTTSTTANTTTTTTVADSTTTTAS